MAENGTSGLPLSSKQEKFIDCLLVGTTLLTAAKTSGISERTAARWRKDTRIVDELTARRKAHFAETLDAFREGLPTAIKLVRDTIEDTETPRAIRLRAAQIWIENAIQLHTLEEVVQGLRDLNLRIDESEARRHAW